MVACKGQSSQPSAAPSNFTVTPGENRVTLTWDAQPNLTYWAFYKAGSSVSTNDTNATIIPGISSSPTVVLSLVNGTQYSFVINAHNNNSKGGPNTSVVTVTPRLLSPDVPWTIGQNFTGNALRGIAFGNNFYVTAGDGGSVFTAAFNYTDAGGVTGWIQPTTLPTNAATNFTSVIYDGARFLALAADGSIIRSNSNSDVATWVSGGPIVGAPTMNALAYGAGIYIAVGDGGTIERNTNILDTSAGAWSPQTSGTIQDLYGVSYLNGQFIAVGAGGTLLTSPDGVTWTARASNTNNNLRQVAYGVISTTLIGTYVAVGDAGTIVSSTDAANWTSQTIPTTQSFYSICFGPDLQFIAAGTNGTLAYSVTGADGTWAVGNAGSVDLYSIAPADVFIAVGAAGTNVSGK